MPRLDWKKQACFTLLLCVTTAITLPAQIFSFFSFDNTNGANPVAAMVEGGSKISGTNIYGTTFSGGANGFGTIFEEIGGTTLHSFDGTGDGSGPYGGLVEYIDGSVYGTTSAGGFFGGGTVFKMTPSGTLTTLYSFCSQYNNGCTDGDSPQTALVQGFDGNFYGTTYGGGTNGDWGTVFKITPTGTFTTIYSFCRRTNCADGARPLGTLIQASDGNLYGTTAYGGTSSGCTYGCGTVFKITRGGVLTTLYSFCSQANCADGEVPEGALLQVTTGGNFYGTTAYGGGSSACPNGCGTIFQITPGGTLATLHSFVSTDGALPQGGLILASDGNFYGTTEGGGTNGNYGTLFQLTSSGTLTTFYSFCSQPGCTDGANPSQGLVQVVAGGIFGTTTNSGTSTACNGGGCGTIFSMDSLQPGFAETIPVSAGWERPSRFWSRAMAG